MQRPVIHIIGAGLAGLSTAVAVGQSPFDIIVHEAARQAGGRCRSYFDESLGMTIDNGNHLLLSGNDSALSYLDAIGARQELRGPKRCEIAFADMASGERWTLRPNEGRLPWWLLLESRRVPRTRPVASAAPASGTPPYLCSARHLPPSARALIHATLPLPSRAVPCGNLIHIH